MTPQELRFLLQVGSLNFPNQLVTPLALVFCYGMGLPVFALAMRIFMTHGLRTRAKKVMFCICTAIICLTLNTVGTFSLIVEMSSNYNAINLFIEEDFNVPATIDILSHHNFVTGNINDWTFSLVLIISDAVVIWRAWVLFPDRQWIMIVPCAILLASLGCTLSEDIRLSIWANWSVYPAGDPIDANLNTATGWLSFATNVVSTFLIAYRLWAYRNFWTKQVRVSNRINSPVQKTLSLLVESGVIFCLSQIVTLVVQYLSQNQAIDSYASAAASRVLVAAMFSFAAVYPTLIIVLVHSQNSVVETYNLTTVINGQINHLQIDSEKPADVETLHFAANTGLHTIHESNY